jgi:hypothetical protein
VLSPVWRLQPFDGKVLKIEGGPHYPDLQRELDRLAVLGVLQISKLKYVASGRSGVHVDAYYCLNFELPNLDDVLATLGARPSTPPINPQDVQIDMFLVDLAGALSTLNDNQIEAAASVDATYADERVDYSNVVDFGSWSTDVHRDNLSLAASERFSKFLPERAQLSAGERLYLYASFLGRRVSGA